MKTILLHATMISLTLGTSFAHEFAVNPLATTHETIVEHRVVQLNQKLGAICTNNYVTTIIDGIKSAPHKSVDCEE